MLPLPSSGDGLAYFAPTRPRVLAHRGLALDAPENTLGAFAAAAQAGAVYIETDVHASRDGISVVSHDPDLSRLAGRQGFVNELTMAELERVELGADQGFCSLTAALDAFPGIRFNIDIKSADAVEPTIRAIRATNAIDRVLVTSFDESRRVRTLRGLPGVATSAAARRFVPALLAAKSGVTPLARLALGGIHAVQVPERALGLAISAKGVIDRFHAAGVEVHFWTINDPERMRALLALGADGLVTDRCDLALEVVRSIP